MSHKRGRAKNQQAWCLMCKANGLKPKREKTHPNRRVRVEAREKP